MANETVITVVGNLTADPEMRVTKSGASLASFTIASTPRSFNRETNQWEDGQALFLNCTVWREMADNVVETLSKGMRVIAQGRLTQRSWETQQGERRSTIELQVDEIGPSLRYAAAQVNRNARGGGGYNRGSNGGNQGFGGGMAMNNQPSNPSFDAPVGGSDNDPWSNPAPAGNSGFDSAPPF